MTHGLKTSIQQALQRSSFYLIVIVITSMLGYLSLKFDHYWDWSSNDRNSLTEASLQVLQQLEGPLAITSYSPDNRELRLRIKSVIEPFLRADSKVSLQFINPASQPAKARALGIKVAGELRIEYQERGENLQTIDEAQITQSIQRLLSRKQHWIVGIEGHGERSMLGKGNYDLGQFGHQLSQAGYAINTLKLTQSPDIPKNTTVLVLASPQTQLLPGEIEQIKQYLDAGGNLLWLVDPGEQHGLEGLQQHLQFQPLPGTVIDATGAKLGLDSPAILPIDHYGNHPITQGLTQLTLFPHAVALEHIKSEWSVTPILHSNEKSWNETGPLKGELSINPKQWESPGPLAIGLALTQRQNDNTSQRILIIGDGDFISNTYLGNGGNLNLGLNSIRWLTEDDQLIDIPLHRAPDSQINLSKAASALIGFSFLFGIPLLLSAIGLYLRWRRRSRH